MGAKTMTVGLGGLVFLVFLFLKLAGIGAVASWSWWWVTCPLWIGIAVWLFVVAVFGLVAGAIAVVQKAKR
jgi:hypothetical protein